MTARRGGAARYEKSMSPLLGYAAEAAFVQKGASLDQPGDDLENTLSYIQASLQMRLRFYRDSLDFNLLRRWPFRIDTDGCGGQGG